LGFPEEVLNQKGVAVTAVVAHITRSPTDLLVAVTL